MVATVPAEPVARVTPRRRFAAVATAFMALALVTLAAAPSTLAWDANAFSSTSEQQLFALTNQARVSAGLRKLAWDSTLNSIARWRSKDMITRNYFSHSIPPSGETVFNVMSDRGYCFHLAGENIGWNNYPDDQATAAVQDAFMNSSGHRANILGTAWDVMAVGAYKGSDGKKMWTVLFADRCGTVGTAPKPTPKPTPRPTARPTASPTSDCQARDAPPDDPADGTPDEGPGDRRPDGAALADGRPDARRPRHAGSPATGHGPERRAKRRQRRRRRAPRRRRPAARERARRLDRERRRQRPVRLLTAARRLERYQPGQDHRAADPTALHA